MFHRKLYTGLIVIFMVFSITCAGNTDSSRTKTTKDFIATIHHGIEWKSHVYSEAYNKLDDATQRIIFDRYNAFMFDTLYLTFSSSIDSLCRKFDPVLCKELLLYIQKTDPFSDTFFYGEMARLYLDRPAELEKAIQTFDLKDQKMLVDFLPDGWKQIKEDTKMKLHRIDSLSNRLLQFYQGITKTK